MDRDNQAASNATAFWGEILSNRISPIGAAPPPEHYSGATTSSVEVLDEKEQILRNAADPILSRYCDEERALESILQELRKQRGCQEHAVGSSISTIRQHRNLLTPAGRLPPEILSQIFVLNAQKGNCDWWVDAADREPEWWVDAPRINSQVCRRWRQIALDCPEIWSISFEHHSRRWIAGMIERSNPAPLFLSDHGMKWKKGMMGLVADNMHRFKSIDLSVQDVSGYCTDDLFEVFSRSAPMLERLTLDSNYLSEWAYATPAFPQEFLSGCTPNLRHLKIRTSTHVLWDSELFTNLTSLEVTGARSNDLRRSSLEVLLTALTRIPGLEFLTLNKSIPRPARPTAGHGHVNLANLKRLELTDSLDHCTNLLGQININASTTLVLNLSHFITRGYVDRFREVFPLHPWETSALTEAPARRTCNAKSDARPAQQGLEVTDPGYTKAIEWARFADLVSPQLRSLRISDIAGWGVDVWRGLAHTSPHLQSLAVGGAEQVAELCKALCIPAGPNVVPADCCFPVLSRLELGAHYNHMMSASDGTEDELSTALARILAARAAIGCSTPELVFIVEPWSEEFPEGWSEPFRKAVPGITVREHRGFASTSDLSFLLRSN